MNYTLDHLKVSYLPTNTIYDPIVLVVDKRIVKVKKTDVNHNGETVDILLDQLPFDECKLLLPTGRLDDEGMDIYEGDYVTYGDLTGVVEYDTKRCAYFITNSDYSVQLLGDIGSSFIHKTGNKYGNISKKE